MDVATVYAMRSAPRAPLHESIYEVIARLKISFKPPPRKPFARRREAFETLPNWRESALSDVVRKVREKDDPDYDEINAIINKLSKQNFDKLMGELIGKLEKRDAMFRLRVTTLLFDRGIRQNVFAPIMADAYAEIAKVCPDALQDLVSQVTMFDTLYDVKNVTVVPNADDPGFNDAILAWNKQKETKRGFAVYVGELYSRNLVQEETMAQFCTTVFADLRDSVGAPRTDVKIEHVDALVRFLFAVAGKVGGVKDTIREILAIPRAEVPCLGMKSRFKLEDALR